MRILRHREVRKFPKLTLISKCQNGGLAPHVHFWTSGCAHWSTSLKEYFGDYINIMRVSLMGTKEIKEEKKESLLSMLYWYMNNSLTFLSFMLQ